MPETNGSEEGSLLPGALRSCISRFDSSVDPSAAEISEFPTFLGCNVGGVAHVLIASISTADIGGYLAFASRSGARAINLYASPAMLRGASSPLASEVLSVLSLQGEGFRVPVRVYSVARGQLDPVSPGSSLQLVVQDGDAGREFLSREGSGEVVDLVLESGCEALFVKDRMIATHLGLEVARSVLSDGRVRLEIGVGRNDRIAKALLEETATQADQLRETIEIVNRYRLGASQFHPLAKLSLARWMRLVIHENPGLVGMKQLTPIELVRSGGWPNGRLWSLKTGSEPLDEDALIYRGSDSSFEEDDISFAIASDEGGGESVVGITAAVDLGAVAKLYEVVRSAKAAGRRIRGSILVMQERNKIVPIERLVDLASFGLRSVTFSPTWKMIDRY
ncbi:MAG: hypothetical protein M0Z39_08590 [Actinomycetota bacterium]|nr:hypothetical protein [Actinomycetota bacterium]